MLAKHALSQLSYGPKPGTRRIKLSSLNSTPRTHRTQPSITRVIMVGLGRFELPTSRLSSARSNQLSYRPDYGANTEKASKHRFNSVYP